MKIIKRDGSFQEFDTEKLRKICLKAFSDFPEIESEEVEAVTAEVIDSVTAYVKKLDFTNQNPTVEDIQDLVVYTIRKAGYRKVANEYKKIREQRALDRTLRGVMDTLSNDDTEEKTDNGNVNGYTCSGRHLHISEDIIKLHAKTKIFPKDIVEAMDHGSIYMNDNGWTGTGSCVTKNTLLYVRDNKGYKMYTAEQLYDLLGQGYCCDILSNGSWVKLIAANRKYTESKIFDIFDRYSNVELTEDHLMLARSYEGKNRDIKVSDLKLDHYLVNDPIEISTKKFYINLLDYCDDAILVLDDEFDENNNIRFIKKILGNMNVRTISKSDYELIKQYIKNPEIQIKGSHTRGIGLRLSLDKDLGYLVGLVLSDGYVSSDGSIVTFTNKDSKILKKYLDIVTTKFPKLNYSVTEKPNNPGVFDITISSGIYNRLFSSILAVKKDASSVSLSPETIGFNNGYLAGLISGYLDGDGCIYSGKRAPGVDTVCLLSSCKGLLEQFREILHILNIPSNIRQQCKTNSAAKFYGRYYNRNTNGYILRIRSGFINKLIMVSNSVKLNGRKEQYVRRRYDPERILDIKEIEYNGYVYDFQTANHYFTANGIVVHNCTCIQIDLEELLKGGFSTGHGYLREPSNIKTAFLQAAIAIQANQNDQHGGQSIAYFDRGLAPYVLKSYRKHLKKLLQYEADKEHRFLDDSSLEEYLKDIKSVDDVLEDNKYISRKALEYTIEDCAQGAESIVHNLNSMASRAGAQVPFSSLNFGLDITTEGRMVTRAILEAQMSGLGHHETPIFPILIFTLKKGVNFNPEDPNYDLFRLAMECSSKRLFPTYAFVDSSFNLPFYEKDPYYGAVQTMGCHSKGTKIRMFDGSLKEVQDIVVGDKLMGTDGSYRTVKELIRGNGPMYKIHQKYAKDYEVNEGHILSLKYMSNDGWNGYNYGDIVNLTVEEFNSLPKGRKKLLKGYKCKYELPEKELKIDPYILGLWLGDGSVVGRPYICVNNSETKILDDIRDYAESNDMYTVEYQRGSYIEVGILDNTSSKTNKFIKYLREYGLDKEKFIPEDYFNGSIEQRKALISGLINSDGWSRIGRGRNSVCFGNTNIKLIEGIERLVDSIGLTYNTILARKKCIGNANHKMCNLKDYYHVNIRDFDSDYLIENKRTSGFSKRSFSDSLISVESIDSADFYGFELDGNQLYLLEDNTVTHNCRTRVMANVNGREGAVRRGNLAFTTINLPLLALDAKGNIDKFYKELDKAMSLLEKALLIRYKLQCSMHKLNFPSLMGQGIWLGSEYLKDTDTLESVLKHGTLSIGFVGLAECLKVLCGKHHGESEEADKLGYEIISHMKDFCDRKTKEHHLNFTCLGSPAESYCKTSLDQAVKAYGIIPEVTDRKYFTNSSHVPVYYDISIRDKAKIEGKYHKLENAGHIFYCEVDGDISKNIDAFEDILHIMADNDIGYGAVNIPICEDPVCGYSWRGIDTVCPFCGRDETEEVEPDER